MRPRLEQDAIHELANTIWDSMFGAGLERLDREGPSEDERFLTGCVQITGAWEGAAVVRCSYTLASHLASAMFGVDELTLEEVCDTVGELANLTAGAVQALMPSPSELSPPSVVEGREYKLVLPRCSIMNQAYFRFHQQPFNIVVFEAVQTGHPDHLAQLQLSEERG
jgi:chemotaxis protein CheX